MEIRVIGLGYIGLPTAIMLSKTGHNVVGYDIDKNKVNKVNSGISPVEEPEIEEPLREEVEDGGLRASNNLEKGDAYFISVQTPLKDNSDEADLSYLKSAIDPLSEVVEDDSIIVIESTVPPGTTEDLYKLLKEKSNKSPYMAHCPERVMPGKIMKEIVENPRVVGGVDPESTELVSGLFRDFVEGDVYETDSRTSEVVKLIENTFRDVNIAIANEISLICEELGINAYEAIEIANSHPRVNYLYPGAGVGGHCLPKDPYLLIQNIEKNDTIIRKSRKRNEEMPKTIIKTLKRTFNNLKTKKIGILGKAYKGGTDDTRNSPSIKIGNELEKQGAKVEYHDPYIDSNIESTFKNSSCVIIGTDHPEFLDLDFNELGKLMENRLLIDGRGMFSEPPEGFKMFGVGRGDLFDSDK